MSTLHVLNVKGESVGEVSFGPLENKRGSQAVHDAVVAYLASQRQGTASTKTKGTVAGSGKKPWRQKGTGRARAGYKQSPVWRGGGVVFGPHPRDYARTLNKKTLRLALRRAFSDKVQAGGVVVLDGFSLSAPKTKEFVTALGKVKGDKAALLVLDQVGADVKRASRNVADVEVVTAADVNVYQVLRYPRLVVSRPALDILQKRLAREERKAS